MKPAHKRFFSSLKQVEKRLKLEDGNPPPPPAPAPAGNPQPQISQTQASESLSSSPIYFYNQTTNTPSTFQPNSTQHPPQEFLSYDEFPPTPNQNPKSKDLGNTCSETSTVDDIDSLIQLLGLSDSDGKGPEMPDVGDDEFYGKIVKVKGPKCRKEVERLDGWIKYLLNNNGRREPLRLAHLLLAKAAFVSVGGGGDNGLEFPSTIDEFLQNDPPSD